MDRFPSLFQISQLKNKPISSFLNGTPSSNNHSVLSWNFNFCWKLKDDEISDFCFLSDILSNIRLNDYREDYRLWVLGGEGASLANLFTPLSSSVSNFFPFFKVIWKTTVPKKI